MNTKIIAYNAVLYQKIKPTNFSAILKVKLTAKIGVK